MLKRVDADEAARLVIERSSGERWLKMKQQRWKVDDLSSLCPGAAGVSGARELVGAGDV